MSELADFAPPSSDVLAAFANIVGDKHLLTDADAMAPYLREWRDRYVGRAACVLRPGTQEEVAELLRIADDHRVAIVPQGGNTGLVGGQIPFDGGNEVVLSLGRLNRIVEVDAENGSITLEAGVILAEAQKAAADAGFLFPLSLASEGSCQIGGNLATNAGGLNVVAYGTARAQCLAVRAALPGGRMVGSLSGLRKDNTGYDLRDVLIGSEGTLGVITAATMRLFPAATDTATAFVGVVSPKEAVKLVQFTQSRAAASQPTALELICRRGVEFAIAHMGARDPLAEPAPWVVLIELSGRGQAGTAMAEMEELLAAAFEDGLIIDAALARSEKQAADFWRLREGMSEAQKYEGGSIKNDISVPVSAIPAFLGKADAAMTRIVPGCRPVPFGHIGDGNLHYNISQPPQMDKQAFLDHWEEMTGRVNELVLEFGGSISAEHGIGRMKRHWMQRIKSPAELAAMRAIKAAFDPHGIMNPGKLLP